MRLLPLLLLAALLAGCASPSEPPADARGPVDLTGKNGLLLVDADGRLVQPLSEQAIQAWMSPSGRLVTWIEADYAILLDVQTGQREVVPQQVWARITDEGTGLLLLPGEARFMDLVTNEVRRAEPVPAAPRAGARWTAASDDFAVLGAEYATDGATRCSNDLFLRAQRAERTVGCHLRVAPDGRAAWTEGNRVRMLDANGTLANVTAEAGGSATDFTAYENPILLPDGVAHLRMRGGQEVALTEVIGPGGAPLAKLDGPSRLALHDVSDDARLLLVTTFSSGR